MPNITKVHLLSVPLENDYLNTYYFADASSQNSFFSGKIKKSYTDFSYQRKDNIIRVPEHVDTLLNLGCNYVMYQNSAYSNKWFYAFIKDMTYINDGRTDIEIETDCIQTWLFDYDVKASFVEREHCNDDTIGINTQPEQLETGDYICNSDNSNNGLATKGYVIASTVDLNDLNFANVNGMTYGGVYSGVAYFYSASDTDITTVLGQLAEAGKSDAVTTIFCVPALFISTYKQSSSDKFAKVVQSMGAGGKNWANTGSLNESNNYKPTTVNGYTPRNNKLFTYPYCYMLMSNNSGGSAIYKYELFRNTNDQNLCDFWIACTTTPGCSVRLRPLFYNGVQENNEEGLNGGKYPICNWNTDVYTNWLTQNGVNIAVSIGSAALQVVGGTIAAATGVGAGIGAASITSGALGIANSVGEIYSHSLQPPQAEGNVNCGDVTFASSKLTFTVYNMSIKSEYARVIDDYFTMFGYKTNRVKIPNKNHRSSYWFTKCIDVNIDGNIPNTDLQIIKNCYNRGITFWRSSTTIQDYSQTNNIL